MSLNLLDVQSQYENIQGFNLTTALNSLETALNNYKDSPISANQTAIETAFSPIAEYYNKLTTINDNLKLYILKSSKNIAHFSSSQDRYLNKTRPEEAISSREVTRGIMPELRIRSIPYLLAISVFMASLTIFLIFQMFGFSGQVNLPPSISAWLSSPASPIPFYMNPMFLGGLCIILLITLIIFIGLYFKTKNATNNK